MKNTFFPFLKNRFVKAQWNSNFLGSQTVAFSGRHDKTIFSVSEK
jgi:hypothetical protein